MLNHLLRLSGLAMVLTLVVPIAQQARSGAMPSDGLLPVAAELALPIEAPAPAPEVAAVPIAEIPAAPIPIPAPEQPAAPPVAAPLNEAAVAIAPAPPVAAPTDTTVAFAPAPPVAAPVDTAVAIAPAPPVAAPVDAAPLDTTVAFAPQAQEVQLEIHLRRREVLVYQGGSVVKRYPIGVGRSGWETPTGTFQVSQMRENPTWISPFNGQRIPGGDPRNPLGTRWIGFWTDGNNWIGFHGAINPSTVGRNASHGCLHMHRADLEDLYRRVHLGTSVTVLP